MNSKLKLFTQPDILQHIGVAPLQEFLSHFIDSDPQFASLAPDSPYYFSELSLLLALSLSPHLVETLLLIEAAASPENSERLAAIAQQKLPSLCVSEFHPLALAVELWLACPEDLLQFGSSRSVREQLDSESFLPPHPSPLPGGEGEAQAFCDSGRQHAELHLEAPSPRGEGTGEGDRDFLPPQTELARNNPPHQLATSAGPHEANEQCFSQAPAICAPSPQGEGWGEGDCDLLPPQTEPTENNPPIENEKDMNGSVSPIENPKSKFENDDGRTGSVSLLNGLTGLITRYVILPQHAAEALALWIVHTYAFELRDVTTYLALESPVRRCGKTTLLNILSRLVNRPLVAANVSPSALYRAIEELRPTLMIDEADTFLKPNDELIGILNGYHRATAYVIRVQNSKPQARNSKRSNKSPSNSPPSTFNRFNPFNSFNPCNPCNTITSYSCWCPKIIARIGRLPETLADRCIIIRMQRKTSNDKCERLRNFDTVAVPKDLRRDCAQFIQDHRDAIIDAKPEIPAALNDRAADIWEPLLAIADCAGGNWPTLAREAALALSSDSVDDFPSPNPIGRGIKGEGLNAQRSTLDACTSLLRDIFILFTTTRHDRLPTRDLIQALNTQFTDRPWMQTRKGQRSTEMWLAEQLRPFGVKARNIRHQNAVVRGYHRDDFSEAFRRYIPAAELDALRAQAETRLSESNQSPETPHPTANQAEADTSHPPT